MCILLWQIANISYIVMEGETDIILLGGDKIRKLCFSDQKDWLSDNDKEMGRGTVT